MTTRHYARLLDAWHDLVGLDHSLFGAHSLRRTTVALIYERTDNLRACQLLLGHTKLETTFAISAWRSTTPWSCLNKSTVVGV